MPFAELLPITLSRNEALRNPAGTECPSFKHADFNTANIAKHSIASQLIEIYGADYKPGSIIFQKHKHLVVDIA
ncbi:hypothetical protein ACQY0O_003277 [Thecaphora frezii]